MSSWHGVNNMRKVLLIIGVVLALVSAGGVFLFLQSTRPTVLEVPVAVTDIRAGEVIRSDLFRLTRLSNVDAQTASKWVTFAEWKQADGKVTTSDIRAGFPIAKAQIDPNSSSAFETRLSLALTGTNDYYVVVPVKPDEVGTYLQPGDRIDLILNLSEAIGIDEKGKVLDAKGIEASETITQSALAPISKLVMQNLPILRLERARVTAASGQQAQTAQTQAVTLGDIKRLYLKVDRDQLEVLSFVLNTGKRTFAVRAAMGSDAALPSDGVTWDDFARWFFAQRAEKPQPFNVASPYEPPESPAEAPK
jgi:Flp pilus assembly protein CpaB